MNTSTTGTIIPPSGTAVPKTERKQNKRRIVADFVARGFRFACDHMPIKRLAGALERTERAVRYWRNGEKEPGATDLLLAARACKQLRSRIIAFLHIPESRLHRSEAELAAYEAQADALVSDAHAALVRHAGEVGGWRRARLSTLAQAAGRLTRLRFRRRKMETV